MAEQTFDQAMQTGRRLVADGKLAEAEALYRRILTAVPNHPLVLNSLGAVLGQAGKLKEAGEVLSRATRADPNFADAWANLANVAEQTNDPDAAMVALRRAIELRGGVGSYHRRLGVCLGRMGDLPAAITEFHKALELEPDSDQTFGDLVLAFRKSGQFDRIIEVCRQRLKENPDNPKILAKLADGMWQSGQFQETTEIWRRLVQIEPHLPDHHGTLSMCLLTLGDLSGGWREYEWRWQCESFSKNVRRDPQREWGCAAGPGRPDVSGRSILLYAEQGIGDTIHFVRYARLLADRGARVLVECPWSLKSLLATCPGVRLTWARGERLPEYDWHIPMLSAAAALETTVEAIPADVPYLFADASRAKSWHGRVESAAAGRLRVGLVWAGSPGYVNDARRSIAPALLAPLAGVQGVALFNLQKGKETDGRKPPAELRLIDFTTSLSDFAETAALIEQLDLVISVDTAVAHLAGAMAKPVWTLLPFVADWRWMTGRTDTPWYPTMRLFRQRVAGNWEDVIEDVRAALAARVASSAGSAL